MVVFEREKIQPLTKDEIEVFDGLKFNWGELKLLALEKGWKGRAECIVY